MRNQRFNKPIELRTHEQPHVGRTPRENRLTSKRSKSQPPHTGAALHRRLQPLDTEKTQGFVPRLPPQHKAHATFMQPLQCVLQPRLPKHHVTAKRRNSQEPALTLRTTRQPSPHPPHTQGTLHRCLQPLDTEKYKVSCSGFLPKTKPMQHSCSHYNAFCSITWQTRMYLLQPQLSHHHSSGKSHQM